MKIFPVTALLLAAVVSAQAQRGIEPIGTVISTTRTGKKFGLQRPVPVFPTHGSVERLTPEFDALIAPGVVMEKLADGFNWSEGPVWLRREQAVVFSDVPENKVWHWSEKAGLSLYLQPSGYTGHARNDRELGSNGLATDRAGNLLLCQHGDRQIARLVRRDGTKGVFEPVVPHFNHRRFNSPNDLVLTRKGDIYFTDPPYGLNGLNNSPLKELMFNGVYLAQKSGEVVLLTSEMTFPNGVALSPDEKTLYVAQSDGNAPILRAFDVQPDGTVRNSRIFFDFKPLAQPGRPGGPDGLKVDLQGNIWTSGPGGILVISPEGKHLGSLLTGENTANCAWGEDGRALYITADSYLLRIRTLARGVGFEAPPY
jgi:gluconolactonase